MRFGWFWGLVFGFGFSLVIGGFQCTSQAFVNVGSTLCGLQNVIDASEVHWIFSYW